jgi:hypothetical protein
MTTSKAAAPTTGSIDGASIPALRSVSSRGGTAARSPTARCRACRSGGVRKCVRRREAAWWKVNPQLDGALLDTVSEYAGRWCKWREFQGPWRLAEKSLNSLGKLLPFVSL